MEPQLPIYLDHNATTPVDERVFADMLPYFTQKYGNAASKTHTYGWVAEAAVELGRERVAKAINATPSEIIFTSGSTEAINLAIKGVYESYHRKGKHIITVKTEHKAVLDCCEALEKRGAEISYAPLDKQGYVDLEKLKELIREDTIMVAVMFANNETGSIQPVHEIARIVHEQKSIFLSDATQCIGKIPLDVQDVGIDLMPISAHKFYGPKGMGALFIGRRGPRVTLSPQIDGGGHERGLRSGTLNVPGIVGLGKAIELAKQEQVATEQRMQQLKNLLLEGLTELDKVYINGTQENCLPNTLNISFEGIENQVLMKQLSNQVAVAAGSACTSAVMEPSHVLSALGYTDERSYSSIRFSIGKFNTQQEIEQTVQIVQKAVQELRK